MNDRICIKQLALPTVVGVPDEERQLPQTVSVNATIMVAKSFAGIDDDLSQTIDYYEITQRLRAVASDGERKLIETLAEDLAAAVLSFGGVSHVQLEVEKFILPNCGAVSVQIERSTT